MGNNYRRSTKRNGATSSTRTRPNTSNNHRRPTRRNRVNNSTYPPQSRRPRLKTASSDPNIPVQPLNWRPTPGTTSTTNRNATRLGGKNINDISRKMRKNKKTRNDQQKAIRNTPGGMGNNGGNMNGIVTLNNNRYHNPMPTRKYRKSLW